MGREETSDVLVKEAAKLIIRENSWEPFNIIKEDESGADGAEDTLESDAFQPRYRYVLTNIAAWDATTQVSAYIAIGYITRGLFHSLHIEQPELYMTASWQGLCILKEGDKVKARFVNTTSGDDIFLVANGYRVPFR